MRQALRAVLGFLLGAVALGLGVGIAALTLGEIAGVSQAEGAFAMGVAFTLVPLAALAGGVAGAIWFARR